MGEEQRYRETRLPSPAASTSTRRTQAVSVLSTTTIKPAVISTPIDDIGLSLADHQSEAELELIRSKANANTDVLEGVRIIVTPNLWRPGHLAAIIHLIERLGGKVSTTLTENTAHQYLIIPSRDEEKLHGLSVGTRLRLGHDPEYRRFDSLHRVSSTWVTNCMISHELLPIDFGDPEGRTGSTSHGPDSDDESVYEADNSTSRHRVYTRVRPRDLERFEATLEKMNWFFDKNVQANNKGRFAKWNKSTFWEWMDGLLGIDDKKKTSSSMTSTTSSGKAMENKSVGGGSDDGTGSSVNTPSPIEILNITLPPDAPRTRSFIQKYGPVIRTLCPSYTWKNGRRAVAVSRDARSVSRKPLESLEKEQDTHSLADGCDTAIDFSRPTSPRTLASELVSTAGGGGAHVRNDSTPSAPITIAHRKTTSTSVSPKPDYDPTISKRARSRSISSSPTSTPHTPCPPHGRSKKRRLLDSVEDSAVDGTNEDVQPALEDPALEESVPWWESSNAWISQPLVAQPLIDDKSPIEHPRLSTPVAAVLKELDRLARLDGYDPSAWDSPRDLDWESLMDHALGQLRNGVSSTHPSVISLRTNLVPDIQTEEDQSGSLPEATGRVLAGLPWSSSSLMESDAILCSVADETMWLGALLHPKSNSVLAIAPSISEQESLDMVNDFNDYARQIMTTIRAKNGISTDGGVKCVRLRTPPLLGLASATTGSKLTTSVIVTAFALQVLLFYWLQESQVDSAVPNSERVFRRFEENPSAFFSTILRRSLVSWTVVQD